MIGIQMKAMDGIRNAYLSKGGGKLQRQAMTKVEQAEDEHGKVIAFW